MRGKEVLKIVLDGFIMFGCNVWMQKLNQPTYNITCVHYISVAYVDCSHSDYLVLSIILFYLSNWYKFKGTIITISPPPQSPLREHLLRCRVVSIMSIDDNSNKHFERFLSYRQFQYFRHICGSDAFDILNQMYTEFA